jgi:hydroxyacylglutathione hydrolase
MKIETLTVGPLGVNCYIIHDGMGKGVVIDPGDEGAQIMATVTRLGIEVTHIINTHGHFDHIGANGYLKEATGAPLLIHAGDAEMLGRADMAAARFGLKVDPSPEADKFISDGDSIESGDLKLDVIHTPGHSPGGVCLYAGDILITGDTIFAGFVGSYDLHVVFNVHLL